MPQFFICLKLVQIFFSNSYFMFWKNTQIKNVGRGFKEEKVKTSTEIWKLFLGSTKIVISIDLIWIELRSRVDWIPLKDI